MPSAFVLSVLRLVFVQTIIAFEARCPRFYRTHWLWNPFQVDTNQMTDGHLIPGRVEIFYEPQRPHRLWGSASLLSSGSRVRRPECEANQSIITNVLINNGWSFTSIPSYVSIARYFVKYRKQPYFPKADNKKFNPTTNITPYILFLCNLLKFVIIKNVTKQILRPS